MFMLAVPPHCFGCRNARELWKLLKFRLSAPVLAGQRDCLRPWDTVLDCLNVIPRCAATNTIASVNRHLRQLFFGEATKLHRCIYIYIYIGIFSFPCAYRHDRIHFANSSPGKISVCVARCGRNVASPSENFAFQVSWLKAARGAAYPGRGTHQPSPKPGLHSSWIELPRYSSSFHSTSGELDKFYQITYCIYIYI